MILNIYYIFYLKFKTTKFSILNVKNGSYDPFDVNFRMINIIFGFVEFASKKKTYLICWLLISYMFHIHMYVYNIYTTHSDECREYIEAFQFMRGNSFGRLNAVESLSLSFSLGSTRLSLSSCFRQWMRDIKVGSDYSNNSVLDRILLAAAREPTPLSSTP